MLQEVALGQRSLADYTHIVGKDTIEEIRALAEPLQGKRVLHVNATAFGGGVSEILYTIVPLMNDIGLDTHWQVILGAEEFFNVTKLMHNSLQGDEQSITDQQWEVFQGYNAMNARDLEEGWDVVIVHDPQPAGLFNNASEKSRHWVWRCHIDLSTPNPSTIERLRPLIEPYEASVWHMQQYVPEGITDGVRIVPPAIDPLSPKNMAFSPEDAAFVSEQFGIDPERPLLCQVSRFDPWKDPMGVIDALSRRPREGAGRPARARRLDGDGRSRGLGLLQPDDGPRRRRPGHQDPLEPQQRRRDRGERLPVAGGRLHPEVDPRGLRPDGDRGALEGAPDDRRRRRRHPAPDRRRRVGIPRLLVGGVRPAEPRDPRATLIWRKRIGKAGKEHARQNFLSPRLLRDWLKIFTEIDV